MVEQQQDGAVAGRQPQQDDVITGATIKIPRTGGRGIRSYRGAGGNSVSKNKSRNKGASSQRTAPGDVQSASQDKQRSLSNPATRQELINRIKALPDEMVPQFMKQYVELMVDTFKINTREKVANLFGQIAAESIRGVAEYVYYFSGQNLKATFGGRVRPQDLNDFIYKNPPSVGNRPFGFAPGKAPWNIGGWADQYYGGRNGNTRGKVSVAKNDLQVFKPDEVIYDKKNKIRKQHTNPHLYKGSSEGYSYRGHGVIQITGKVQYERMNEFFGRNGKYEKNDVDFLENPEICSYNWNSKLGPPNKFAFLSALMWWSNHDGVYINNVSLQTTRKITKTVRGAEGGYQERHKDVERYFAALNTGTKPAANSVAGTYNITAVPTYSKVIKPSQLRFLSIIPSVSALEYSVRYGLKTFSNLSYFESNGTPTPPYKDKTTNILKFLPGQQYPVFGIDKNNNARIYDSSEVTSVWNNLVYACAGFPRLIKNGKPAYSDSGGKYGFNRLTGRTSIGIKPSGELVVYISKNKYISSVINDLLAMGCVEAINFDGGASTFVYDNGSPLITSSRRFPSIMTWT